MSRRLGLTARTAGQLLPIVIDIFNAATRRWLVGTFPASEVKLQIETGCQFLKLPDGVVESELACGPGRQVHGD
jgi:hypothetical protein